MKVFISADMEGISGIARSEMTYNEDRDYGRARELMTGDVNAAIQGCLDAGAAEIVVHDSHGGAANIFPEKFLAPARLIQGWGAGSRMMEGLDATFNAALLVGYHARAMTEAGTISHTMTGRPRGVWYNGVEVGESGISAAHAGALGVPLVFASGDEALGREVHEVIGAAVETVAVKEALDRECVKLLPLEEARELIQEGVARALLRPATIPPFVPSSPITVRMAFQTQHQAATAARVPTVARVDGTTVEAKVADGLAAADLVSVLLDVAH